MSIEKLQKALTLIQECIDEYEGEESMEGEDASPGDGYNDSTDTAEPEMGGGAGDKIKMAAALMKRRS